MASHSRVVSDLAELRSELHGRGSAHRALLQLSPARPVIDIAFDWAVVLASVGSVAWFSWWMAPLAVCLIANRQRALGNILHDAGHRNLWRDRMRNDLLARLLVAPLLFNSLTRYREAHFRHHMSLGDARGDPDLLPIPNPLPRHWLANFARQASAWPAVWGSISGHLAARGVRHSSRIFILGWWGLALVVLTAATDADFAAIFVGLWLVARGTVFHLITMFREMCDHHGLSPGGVFSFTRDMPCHGLWRAFIHPRNNGYHLTHHLLPAVPYYRLPEAHELFSQMPAYRARAHQCHSYFGGDDAVIHDWQAGAAA